MNILLPSMQMKQKNDDVTDNDCCHKCAAGDSTLALAEEDKVSDWGTILMQYISN